MTRRSTDGTPAGAGDPVAARGGDARPVDAAGAPADADALRTRALDRERAGDEAAAVLACTALLALEPDDPVGLHLLGVLRLRAGRAAQALTLLVRAVAPEPAYAGPWLACGDALLALERAGEALAHYDRGRSLAPGDAGVHVRRSAALLCLDRAQEALDAADEALALAGAAERGAALRRRAGALVALGRPEEALASLDALLAVHPRDAAAHVARASLLLGLARPAEALAAADRALAILPAPAAADAQARRGAALLALGEPAAALASLEAALAGVPEHAEAIGNRVVALAALGRLGEALLACEQALARAPESALLLRHRARLLFDLGRPEDALADYDRALALEPAHVEAHVGRATALRSLARVEEACVALTRALALDPGHAQARFNLADCCLHRGLYREGFAYYEARRRLPGVAVRDGFAAPQWHGGQPLAGRTLFVWWEQAFGDTLQFVRYLPLARARGARVVLSVPRALHRLLGTLGAGIELLGEHEAPAAYDYHVPLLSLPGAFATDADSIPAQVPYLGAEPERVAQWRRTLGDAGFRIAVCWQGASRPMGHGRSFALAALEPLARVPGVRLISVQKGEGLEQLDRLPPGMVVERPPAPLDTGPDAFVDTAALLSAVDLVVSCDTSIAHLAGALARPTWLALKFVPDWRWGLTGPASPWYPTLTLFRQARRWDWAPVFAQMAARLQADRGALPVAAPPSAPAVELKPAGPADAGALATLAARAYRAEYADLWEDGGEGYVARAFAPDRLAAELASPGAGWWFLCAGGHPVGFLKVLWPAPGAADQDACLERLYLLPEWTGRGVGRHALQFVADLARGRGVRSVWLRAMADRPRVLAAYRRAGYRTVGTEVLQGPGVRVARAAMLRLAWSPAGDGGA